MSSNLTWKLVDTVAEELGAGDWARRKWRTRGVPPAWRIKIVEALMAKGAPIALSDFDRLDPERAAA